MQRAGAEDSRRRASAYARRRRARARRADGRGGRGLGRRASNLATVSKQPSRESKRPCIKDCADKSNGGERRKGPLNSFMPRSAQVSTE